MAFKAGEERIAELLAKADEASKANENAKAASILREASQIDPDDVEVKKRWLALQSREDGGQDSIATLRTYLRTGTEEDGQHVRQAVTQQRQLTSNEATEAHDLLTGAVDNDTLTRLGEFMGLLIQRHTSVRKLIATKLTSTPTQTFEQLYHLGDDSFKALVPVVLETALWPPDGKLRTTAQQDLFRLSLATLIEAGVAHSARAMGTVTHLLTAQPEHVVDLLDEDVVDIVLSDLDIRLDGNLRRLAMLAASKILEVTGEKGEGWFARYVRGKVAEQDYDDLILAFSAAAAVFPILPGVAAGLFMTEGFVAGLVPSLERNSEDAALGKRKSLYLEQAALELLSAACVDKPCRSAIATHCVHWLRGLAEEREGIHRALAALILAKISGEESVQEDVTNKLTQLVVAGEREGKGESEQAIEGLAYTSLQPKVKEEIAGDAAVLAAVVKALTDRPGAVFGCLTVFANLTAYRPALSDEQKKMAQLKAYANSANAPPLDPLDNDKYVTARCRKVLDHDIVPALVVCCSGNTQRSLSATNVALVVKILLALAKEQKHRAKMAQQGAVKLLLQIRERVAKKEGKTTDDDAAALIGRNAAHALARLLISVNPAHVFSSSLPASSAVSALSLLLSPPAISPGEGARDLLPTFESLLALTNLASMDDPTARELLLRTPAFDNIEELMFSANTLVQRATVELMCNLMVSPACVAKFADGRREAKGRLGLLLALTDAEDLATRRAAGGAVAVLTEWDGSATAVLDATGAQHLQDAQAGEGSGGGSGVQAVLRMCADASEEVMHRGLVCLGNIVGAPGEVGVRGVRVVRELGGVKVVRKVLIKTRDENILGLGQEILGKLG